ncbi:hypothetical protein GUJ93_ZPchr0004g39145 [Zizania palustris]|uniref:Uncharacterized protein n=1 Tax=Zizania palustris TaxID=103762 RepID=A0A8J5VZ90_ZIZPA|nr:hypothetical protein GUJ93_ZPchr0004g39145 [Zizania palustris]
MPRRTRAAGNLLCRSAEEDVRRRDSSPLLWDASPLRHRLAGGTPLRWTHRSSAGPRHRDAAPLLHQTAAPQEDDPVGTGVPPASLPERRPAGASAGAATRRRVHRSGASQSSGEESRRRTSSSAERQRRFPAAHVLLGRAAERSPGSATAKTDLAEGVPQPIILRSQAD